MFSKIIIVFSTTFVFAITVYILFFISSKNIVESDFASFLTGSEIIKNGEGRSLYDVEVQKKYQAEIVNGYSKNIFLPFRSLPFVGLIFIPFTFVNFIVGYKIYALLNVLLLVLTVYLIGNFATNVKKLNLSFLLSFLFVANLDTVFYSQLSIVLLLIFTLIQKYLIEKKEFNVGFFSGLLLLKPTLLLFIPFLWLILKTKVPFITGFLTSLLIITGFSFAASGFDFLPTYINFISLTETAGYGSNLSDMYSLPSAFLYLNKTLNLNMVIIFLLSALTYLLTLRFFVLKRFKADLVSLYTFAVMVVIFLSPHVLVHDLSILTLPMLLMLQLFISRQKFSFSDLLTLVILFVFPITSFIRSEYMVLLNVLIFAVEIKLTATNYVSR